MPGVPPFAYNVFLPETPETFTYDGDGNLTQDGVWDYEWDAEDRLTAMSMRPEAALIALGQGGRWVRLEFGYDLMGRRIKKSFLKSSSDPQQIINSNGSVLAVWSASWSERYVYEPGQWVPSMSYRVNTQTGHYDHPGQSFAWGPDLSGSYGGAGGIGGLAVYSDDDVNTQVPYAGALVPFYDGNGNVVQMRSLDGDTFGQPLASYEYGPFGEVRSITGEQGHRNPFRWSTKWTDAETGLVYFGYRYYVPGMGRWLSRDPAEEVGGLNELSFVENSPSQAVDPLGLWLYRADRGTLRGSVGPVLGDDGHAVKWASDFSLTFEPNRYMQTDGCFTCEEVKFIQIYKSNHQLHLTVPYFWYVDATNPPFYDNQTPGNPSRGNSSRMWDRPGAQVAAVNFKIDLETCAVCTKGTAKSEVYGCFKWGAEFELVSSRRTVAWDRWYVLRYLGSTKQEGETTFVRAAPWAYYDVTPWSLQTVDSGRSAISGVTYPSADMKRLILDNARYETEFWPWGR